MREKMQALYQKLKAIREKNKTEKTKTAKIKNKTASSSVAASYFVEAGSWASDMVGQLLASRDRYKKMSILLLATVIALTLGITAMAFTHQAKILVVHRDDNGVVWASWAKNRNYVSTTKAELRSELTRYVITRESYHYDNFNFQYKMIGILSTDSVFNTFKVAQSTSSNNSNLNVLGQTGTKTVKVTNIVFIDTKESHAKQHDKSIAHQNLAQIYYTVTTHALNTPERNVPYIATVSWKYEGVPSNPEYQAYDWNGFTITRYDITQATTLGDNANE